MKEELCVGGACAGRALGGRSSLRGCVRGWKGPVREGLCMLWGTGRGMCGTGLCGMSCLKEGLVGEG